MYIKNNVIQKIINEYSYNILMICKHDCSIESVQKYIQKEYMNYSYLSYQDLYQNLLGVVLDICNEQQIKNILLRDIPLFYNKMPMENNGKVRTLSYQNLCEMLIIKMMLLQIRINSDDRLIDLFLIDKDNLIMTMDEYDESILNKRNNIYERKNTYN